jgi:hypothetical protein
MVRHALNLPAPDAGHGDTYEPGKLFIRYTLELVTDMGWFQKMVTTGERGVTS